MEKGKERFSKIPIPTNRRVTETLPETLLGVEYDTKFEEDKARRKGISLEEYQGRYGEKHGQPSSEEKKESQKIFNTETNILMGWLFKNIMGEFPHDKKAIEIFQRAVSERAFLDIWNHEISISEKSSKEQLKKYLLKTIKFLETKSGFGLGSERIASLEGVSGATEIIQEQIRFLEEMNEKEYPSEEIYHTARANFIYRAHLFLRRKIVIEKLEDLLSVIGNNY